MLNDVGVVCRYVVVDAMPWSDALLDDFVMIVTNCVFRVATKGGRRLSAPWHWITVSAHTSQGIHVVVCIRWSTACSWSIVISTQAHHASCRVGH